MLGTMRKRRSNGGFDVFQGVKPAAQFAMCSALSAHGEETGRMPIAIAGKQATSGNGAEASGAAIYITVRGSVMSEGDFVKTVRNGLLRLDRRVVGVLG